MSVEQPAYPIQLNGDLSKPPANGWWLIKWIMSLPHVVILAFLWIAYLFVSIIAFFAILFTAKYPKSLFDFNVGVLRWTWRVDFYAFGVLGTDKYPPFSLQPDPNYAADIVVPYPEKLSQGLVLVKWWLLAIPHYFVVGAFWGGGRWRYIGLGWVLVIIAAVVLLFTGKYREDLFKLVMGINRWTYRVTAYASLMTDKYPPFRLWD